MFEGTMNLGLFFWLLGAPLVMLVVDNMRTPDREAAIAHRSEARGSDYHRT